MSVRQLDIFHMADGGSLSAGSVVLGTSWGNDSVALAQWCLEAGLPDVTCLYNNTGWEWPSDGEAEAWSDRVERLEAWARGVGFKTARTSSIGMEALVHRESGWPRQGMQFCTWELKVKPTIAWLAQQDPHHVAVFMNGKRRAESTERRNTPEWVFDSVMHGGRTCRSPLFDHDDAARDTLIKRSGHAVLPHKSRECICVNTGAEGLRQWPEAVIAQVERIETDLGVGVQSGKPKTMFRPARKLGATGIREVIQWAHAGRGKYRSVDDGTGPSGPETGCDGGFCWS